MLAVFTLNPKFKESGLSIEIRVQKLQIERQTMKTLGLHCLPRPVCQ